ncbi:unnamed protein product [Lactuca virosa]|uniref:DUF4283 domain-containing protein n=1 Tax=Lactuca virosa TaxID=75947 RepID=A0AAU9LW15_9ASTR|nr:unnamed protein product [Lactuca virosa]
MLSSLNQVRCGHYITKVNVAKYEKKPNPKLTRKPISRDVPPSNKKPAGGWNKKYDGRSFADAVTGRRDATKSSSSILTKAIILNRVAVMEIQSTLMGEVNCFQLLSNLLKLINADGNIPCYVFYAGGLKAILKFSSGSKAEGYLNSKHSWNRWFKWLKLGIMEDVQFERVAWVKIIGLPIHLRSEENASLIVSNFGKVIEVDGCQNWCNIDLSSSYARILTSTRKLINEEVNCSFNGRIHSVGVVECEDIWKSFSKYYESDSETSNHDSEKYRDVEEGDLELSDTEDEGISETWENNIGDQHDVEEGEIVMEYVENNVPEGADDHEPSLSPATSKKMKVTAGTPTTAINSELGKPPIEHVKTNDANPNKDNNVGDGTVAGVKSDLESRPMPSIRLNFKNAAHTPSGPPIIHTVTDVGISGSDFGGSHSKKRKLDDIHRSNLAFSLTPRRLVNEFTDPVFSAQLRCLLFLIFRFRLMLGTQSSI